MSGLGAFVITYDRPRVLAQTLSRLLGQTRAPDRIVVVNNGAREAVESLVAELPATVEHGVTGRNRGPAGAASMGGRRLLELGVEWICWGDEDDPPYHATDLEALMRLAHTSASDVGGVGAVGSRFDWRRGELERLRDDALHGVVEVDLIAGNSQFIERAEAARQAGPPDSRLFFGGYEVEQCLRIRRAGYRLLVDGDLMRRYREAAGRLRLAQQRQLVSQYPVELLWRRYYRSRNYVFMMSRRFGRSDLALRESLKAVARCVASFRRGTRYGAVFTRAQLLGIVDGWRARMGPTMASRPKAGVEVKREEIPASSGALGRPE